ncbi:MAG TPA: TolC family protein [Clostridia bacterium]|nr:TolC family protein [Clostridia bacterium]
MLIATAAFGQQVGADLYRTSTQTAAAPVNAPSPQIGIDNSFLGSVPQGEVTPGVVSLTLLDAIDRGLKFNLGLLLADQGNLAARGARWQALSSLLPNLQAGMAESVQQVNLAAYGLPRAPGTPSVVGPFSVFDTRAVVTQKVVDFHDLYNSRAANENVRAAQFSYQNARDLVVLVVGASYLQALAGSARVGAAEAQFRTAQTIYRQSVDLKNAGMIAGIDVLRAQVEMQAQQQRLLIAQNDFSKQLLALARTIGMPLGQQFTLADRIPNAKAVPITLDEAFKSAYEKRADYGRAQSLLKAAELTRKAAIGGALPSLGVTADYGLIGATPGNSHGTFSTAAALKLPIFQGGKVRGDVMQADALMNRRRAELDDLRGRIEYEVRTAFLDLNAAAQQLEVATSALDVARQQVAQSRDRFAAGVTNNVELVQAQEAQANAEENFIASLYAHNFAKLSLARALGIAEDATRRNF